MCGKNAVYEKIGNSSVNGYPAYTAILGCSKVLANNQGGVKNENSEFGFHLVIQGAKDLYVIQKLIRGPAFENSNPPITRQNVIEYMQPFLPIALCKNQGDPNECVQ